MNDSTIWPEFLNFLKEIAANNNDYEKWKKYAQQHYHDEKIEHIRVRLVKICNDDDSIGNDKWPLTDEALKKVQELVGEFEKNTS